MPWSVVGISWLGVLVLTTVSVPADLAPSGAWVDKIAHVLAWAVLGATLWLAWHLTHPPPLSRYAVAWRLIAAWAAATMYGVAIEGVQALLPARSADPADAAADAIGAALGVLGVAALTLAWTRRRQRVRS